MKLLACFFASFLLLLCDESVLAQNADVRIGESVTIMARGGRKLQGKIVSQTERGFEVSFGNSVPNANLPRTAFFREKSGKLMVRLSGRPSKNQGRPERTKQTKWSVADNVFGKQGVIPDAKPRMWTSRNGKFTFDATLTEIRPSGQLRLTPTSGDETISVEPDRISKADLDYVRSLLSTAQLGHIRPIEMIGTITLAGREHDLSSANKFSNENRARFSFPEPTEKIDFAKNGLWLPDIGDPKSIHHASEFGLAFITHRLHRDDETAVLIVAMDSSSVVGQIRFPYDIGQFHDVSPDNTKILMANRHHLDLWETDGAQIRHVYRWLCGPTKMACFNAKGNVVTLNNRDLVVWSDDNTEPIYRFTEFAGSNFVLSSDRRTLVGLKETKRSMNVDLVQLDIVDGKQLKTASTGLASSSFGIAVDERQKQIVIMDAESCVVFGSNGEKLQRFPFEGLYEHGRATWLDDRFVISKHSRRCLLVDTKVGASVWQYETKIAPLVDPSGRAWFVTTSRDGNALFPFDLPHESVWKFLREIDSIEQPRQGESVQLKIDLPFASAELNEIETRLTNQLKSAGMTVVDREAKLVFEAGYEMHEKTHRVELKFRAIDPKSSTNRKNETVVVRPSDMWMRLTQDGKVLWKREHSTGYYIAPMLVLGEEESAQKAVNEQFGPQTDFYDRVRFPQKFVKAVKALDLPSTILTGDRWLDR